MELPFCLLGQISIVLLRQPAGGITDVKFEHSFPCIDTGKWDIDTFLKPGDGEFQRTDHRLSSPRLPSFNSVIQSPRDVRGSKDEHTGVVVTNTVHLN